MDQWTHSKARSPNHMDCKLMDMVEKAQHNNWRRPNWCERPFPPPCLRPTPPEALQPCNPDITGGGESTVHLGDGTVSLKRMDGGLGSPPDSQCDECVPVTRVMCCC
ncbi:unnamed protein product [Boreogadus saida]